MKTSTPLPLLLAAVAGSTIAFDPPSRSFSSARGRRTLMFRGALSPPQMSLQIVSPAALGSLVERRVRTRAGAASVAIDPGSVASSADAWTSLATTTVVGAGLVAVLVALVRSSPDVGAAVAAYNQALAARPFTTKAIGTGITYVASDLTAQALEGERAHPLARLRRALRFGAVGAFWVGPLLAAWFQFMDFIFPGTTVATVAAKVVMDQCLQGPFMIASMFILTGVLAGESQKVARAKTRRMLFPTWIKSVWVWSPVQLIQQTLVPLQYRVAVANLVSYFWDTYLAHEMGPEGSPDKAHGAAASKEVEVLDRPAFAPNDVSRSPEPVPSFAFAANNANVPLFGAAGRRDGRPLWEDEFAT